LALRLREPMDIIDGDNTVTFTGGGH